MAGQIRKGFFFYFGLFVLLLAAIFLVCLVVMIFNPGQTVMWMQYFTDNNTYMVEEAFNIENENEKIDINWAEVSDLEINCTYANVTVERDNSNKLTKTGLYVENNAKGFTAASSAVKFEISAQYEILEEGKVKLIVNVAEPEGFLFFSKDVNIVLHSSSMDGKTLNFENVALVVNTTDGDVNLGGSTATYQTDFVEFKSVKAETDKGNIRITKNLKTTALTMLDLKTGSGNISSSKQVSYSNEDGNQTGTGIDVGCDVNLTTDKGDISFDAINGNEYVEVTCKRGNVILGYVKSKEVRFISCVQGNYVFGLIYGNLTFDSQDTIISPNITADKIFGNFVLATKEEKGSSPDITINHVQGFLNVYASKGHLYVGEVGGAVEVESTGGLSVILGIGKNNTSPISVLNKDGSVSLKFKGLVSKNVLLETTRGKINVDVTKDAAFVAMLYQNNEDKTMLPDANISVNIGSIKIEDTNPRLIIGENGGTIEVTTNSSVSFNLVDVAV